MSNQNLGEANEQSELHRSLSNRHLQLIAIGGAIGAIAGGVLGFVGAENISKFIVSL